MICEFRISLSTCLLICRMKKSWAACWVITFFGLAAEPFETEQQLELFLERQPSTKLCFLAPPPFEVGWGLLALPAPNRCG